ncbi:hypothetical protein [Sulfurisphaera ohwakuensis]|uniref:Uncharacterized protein n=1 Tax=Sulfurisphaera ohwakuensis TaxID=69656 RepID=A0A650CKC9_SULOH|nr:hypothetical protein [Sulfurisphaera ohwakuensis]MBB5254275.1 hypothetical protein [Sulfurisphaera ohwakuensis]QGR18173.1 hypothetical protein D1869_13980 [Sulfurisphaera ohwakuensis]
MSNVIKKNLKYFLLSYIIFSFFELLFNREFLMGVLPLGYAGINLSTSLPFLIMFYIGAFSFGMIFILQFVILFLSAYFSNLNKLTKGFLWSILYLTILFDLIHIALGVNYTGFNLPIISSLAYTVMILVASILVIMQANRVYDKIIMFLLLVPDIDAYLVLIGSWLTELSKSSTFNIINIISGESLAYLVLISGVVFIGYTMWNRISWKYIIPGIVVGLPVFIIAWFNLIPGVAMAIGFTFPYVLGMLGVRNWMPPLFFLIAVLALFSAIGLYKKNQQVSLTALALFGGALIFDTVTTTTYMLIPLIATLIGGLIKEKIKV